MKLYKALLASLFFILILLCVYYVHIAYFKINVVLYSAVFDVGLATLATSVLLFNTGHFKPLGSFEKLQLSAIWLLGGCVLALSIPTIIDRSLSFYLLEKLQQRGGKIQQARFEDVFTKEYMKEHRLIDIRLTEQEQSGTITLVDGCVILTKKGAWFATFSRHFRAHFLPKQRLVMGKYSDDLTDPFRVSALITDYTCG
jgi:uncharacterized membrane protein (DUF373 family)